MRSRSGLLQEGEVLNGLALCAGVGGLELGLGLAIEGYKCVGYVEREAFAASVLVARMDDKILDQAPIWDDLKTFPSKDFIWKVDIISAGFPCQPWSVAGKRKGTEDERWLWPEIQSVICEVGPSLIFLENVPGLLSGGLGQVLGDLAQTGFDAEWGCFTAAEVGASHRRERVFVLAYTPGFRTWGKIRDVREEDGGPRARLLQRPNSPSGKVANDQGIGCEQGRPSIGNEAGEPEARISGNKLGNPTKQGLEIGRAGVAGRGYSNKSFPPGPQDELAWDEWRKSNGPEPALRRSADGMAYRVDRLRACGNGVVPLEAAYAFRTLAARAGLMEKATS